MIKKLIRKVLGIKKTAPSPQTPVILPPVKHGIDVGLLSSNAIRVTKILQDAGYEAFVVGGAVRDLLLGIKPKDFDVATNATPEQVRKLFRRSFLIGRRFQIVHVLFGQDLIEVTTFRGGTPQEEQKDETGRLLRDNTFGTQQEDATRRDFTINAMYYDPSNQTVHDYHGGIEDIRNKKLRIIGSAQERFREDPVRMLRVVRFAAKLGFQIDDATSAPIAGMAPLINNVPASRLFDEMLKLLTSGQSVACIQELRTRKLHHGLLPLLDEILATPLGERFINLALAKTDQRILEGKSISPGFLFAVLLWNQVAQKWQQYCVEGQYAIPALQTAAYEVLETQTEKLALHRRIASDMRDIWTLQPRFERRTGKMPYRLLQSERFRAGYDFLLLRCEAGEIDAEIGDWWTRFAAADGEEREAMLNASAARQPAQKPRSRRKLRRSGRKKNSSEMETSSSH